MTEAMHGSEPFRRDLTTPSCIPHARRYREYFGPCAVERLRRGVVVSTDQRFTTYSGKALPRTGRLAHTAENESGAAVSARSDVEEYLRNFAKFFSNQDAAA